MYFLHTIIWLCTLTIVGFSQTLFDDSIPKAPKPLRVDASVRETSAPASKGTPSQSYVIVDLGELIIRGDIRVGYQTQPATGWGILWHSFYNPDVSQRRFTGTYGIMGGGRLYPGMGWFGGQLYIQGLIGAVSYDDAGLSIALALGQRMRITPSVLVDIDVSFHRIYIDTIASPQIRLGIGIACQTPPITRWFR